MTTLQIVLTGYGLIALLVLSYMEFGTLINMRDDAPKAFQYGCIGVLFMIVGTFIFNVLIAASWIISVPTLLAMYFVATGAKTK